MNPSLIYDSFPLRLPSLHAVDVSGELSVNSIRGSVGVQHL